MCSFINGGNEQDYFLLLCNQLLVCCPQYDIVRIEQRLQVVITPPVKSKIASFSAVQ